MTNTLSCLGEYATVNVGTGPYCMVVSGGNSLAASGTPNPWA